MKSLSFILKLTIISACFSNFLLNAQTILKNDITEQFKNRYVYNFLIDKNRIWIYDGLLRMCENNKITTYNVNENSSGPLSYCVSSNQFGEKEFDYMIAANNSIFLGNNDYLVQIRNDSIFSTNLNYLGIHERKQIISVQKGPNFSLVFHVMFIDQFGELRSCLYKFNDEKFFSCSLNSEIDSFKIRQIIPNSMYIYIIITKIEVNDMHFELICFDNDRIKNKIRLDAYYSYYEYKYDISGDTLLLLNNQGILYKIVNDSLIERMSTSLYSGKHCFNFVYNNSMIYYTKENKVYLYNINENQREELFVLPKTSNFCECAIRDMKINDDRIYISYSQLYPNCFEYSTGFDIIDLNVKH